MDDTCLRYFREASGIPLAIYGCEGGWQQYAKMTFDPDPAVFYLQPLIEQKADMEIVTWKDTILFGYVYAEAEQAHALLGPVREGACSLRTANLMLEEMGLAYNRTEEILLFLESCPKLSRVRLLKQLVFLNYLLNGREPPGNFIDDKMASLAPFEDPDPDIPLVVTAHDSQEAEECIMACIEYGKTDELLQILKNEKSISAEMGDTGDTPLRAFKNVFIAAVALSARAAVRGGMDYEASMRVSDAYLHALEMAETIEETFSLWRNMMLDYTEYTRKCRSLSASSKLVHKVYAYVDKNLYKPLLVSELADMLGYNRAYLGHRFKEDSGRSLAGYIRERKIEEACRLLRSSDKAVADIAELLGYSSLSYFHNAFKKATGRTPGAFRNSK